jgi:hypothetical protein
VVWVVLAHHWQLIPLGPRPSQCLLVVVKWRIRLVTREGEWMWADKNYCHMDQELSLYPHHNSTTVMHEQTKANTKQIALKWTKTTLIRGHWSMWCTYRSCNAGLIDTKKQNSTQTTCTDCYGGGRETAP